MILNLAQCLKGKFDKFNFIEWFFNKFELDINKFIVYHNSIKFENTIKKKFYFFKKTNLSSKFNKSLFYFFL